MNSDMLLEEASRLLAPWARESSAPEPGRLDVVVDAADLLGAVAALHAARWGYLAALTGLDPGAEQGMFELLYHFCAASAVLTLRVPIPRAAPSVASVCGVIPSASCFERELAEMFGVVVVDTPDPSRLYLAEDWPAEVYPLRKDAVV